LRSFPPKAKRVIYLHMVGGPSQMDLFDYKPQMQKWYDKDLPESIRKGQRLTTMTSGQARFPIAPSKFNSARAGKCGMWMNTTVAAKPGQKRADDICWMRSLHTEAINHEPAICAMQTGNQSPGRPCLGSWASYGLGSMNENLPTFVVLVATPTNREQEQAISARLWSAAICPASTRAYRSAAKATPSSTSTIRPGVPDSVRKRTIEGLNALNELNYQQVGDPETHTRIQQYEMAFRMQASVPELTDITKEPDHVYKLYGEEAKKPGSFANSVLMARRLAERGVRFVQIYHNNWDHHSNVGGRMPSQCKDVDQPCARPHRGPQTARHVRRHPHHLGRRIRPHDLLPGRPDQGELRTRPPPALLQHVDGRRRHQRRRDLRRDRRLQLQHRQGPAPHQRLPRHRGGCQRWMWPLWLGRRLPTTRWLKP
jgi:hypothetical protein